jgi:hypothetical protein
MIMVSKCVRLVLACSLVGLFSIASADAQVTLNNRTVVTFSQPVEVPGKVLPAGSYTFELHSSPSNRHLIEIYDQAGKVLLTTVMAIPDYRGEATEETVIKFKEVATGQPQAIRAWFYPGQTVGHELIYSKSRAAELAAASNVAVQAMADTVTVDTMKTAEVVVIQPKPVEPVPAPTPVEPVAAPVVAPPPPVVTTPVVTPVEPAPPTPAPVRERREELPRTASNLMLVTLFGIATIAIGFALRGLSTKATR